MRFRLVALLLFAAACGGGGSAPAGPAEPADSEPAPQPQVERPAVDAEVVGLPGDPVPGLNAYYVTTMLGWLAPEGDVIFEAVIQWKPDNTLGCGILRRAPEGRVHPLLMQGQPLPGTGGVVRHPKLPLESRDDLLIMAADVEGGTIDHGLFAVPRTGGVPRLLAEGRFAHAVLAEDGTVLAQREEDRSIVSIPPDGPATLLLADCEPGFSSDGRRLVVRRGEVAWVLGSDGAPHRIVGFDDAVPGTAGTVTRIRGAWVNDAGAFVVHVDTSDRHCPEALLRITDGVEVLAICGAPAPGTTLTVERIRVAGGRSRDVVFAAGLESAGAIVYCARPGEAPLPVAASGPDYRIRETEVVVDGASIAFGATTPQWDAVYRIAPGRAPERLMGTDGAVPAARDAELRSFPIPLEVAIDVDAGGRTLVHAGLVEERRPDATLGALLLMR